MNINIRTIAAALIMVLAVSCRQKTAVNAPDHWNGTYTSVASEKPDYDSYFTGERLRIDLVLTGNDHEQSAFLTGMSREAGWAGPKDALLDPFGYGEYYYELLSGDKVIFSRGLCPLFQEWRSTAQAKTVDMAMTQTVWMPFPKDSVHFVLYSRDRRKQFVPLFQCDIDPTDKLISYTPLEMPLAILHNGDVADKVDLLFIAEGYTVDRMDKFIADAARFTDYLFTFEPYASRKSDFNVWALQTPSLESGVDIPQDDMWRQTLCQSGFYTFYIDRYLTVQDHTAIARAVAATPFDALFVIANETKYGGGGFYNSYAMGTSDNERSNQVFIHEFGHSFAGLADEYYDSEVAYDDDYYPAGVEPWEPNITSMVGFASKWQDMLPEGTPVPTPDDKAHYGQIGVFEGAGYQSHGLYRPFSECRMLNNTAPAFCPVCQRAIERMIDFYCR